MKSSMLEIPGVIAFKRHLSPFKCHQTRHYLHNDHLLPFPAKLRWTTLVQRSGRATPFQALWFARSKPTRPSDYHTYLLYYCFEVYLCFCRDVDRHGKCLLLYENSWCLSLTSDRGGVKAVNKVYTPVRIMGVALLPF